MKVTVVKMGQAPKSFEVPAGSAVCSAIEKAGMSIQGCKIAVDGNVVDDVNNMHVEGDMTIVITPRVEGGN